MSNSNIDIQNTIDNIDTKGVLWTEREFSHPERTIRLATSFSGIGAIEYAFKRLGLNTEIVFAGDIEPNCKKTYFANYTIKDEQWHTDIKELDAKPYRNKVDLFVGGAPCQAFSIVGDQLGFADTRGTLFREFAQKHNLNLIEFLPEYDKYPPKIAPLKRNKLIVENCDCLMAFWDGKSRGTKFTLDYAKQLGKPIKIVQI